MLLILAGAKTYSQDLASAKQLWEEKRLAASREAIDAYLEEAGADDAEGWLLKATIYAAMVDDPRLKYLVADGRMDAFAAIKKAANLNQKWVTGELTANKFELLKVIDKGCTSDGVAFFNAGAERKSTADFSQALEFFKKAHSVREFAQKQGWKPAFQPNDTVLLYNTTQSAINAQKEDEAVLYARKLAERSISSASSYSKADFENIYQWLVNYYNMKKDGANLQLFAAKGARIYPGSLYFATVSINNFRETGNDEQLLKAGEVATRAFPGNTELLYSYCSDLFTYIYSKAAPGKSKIYQSKLEQNLSLLIKAQPDSSKAYLLLGKHYYNMAVAMQKAGGSVNTKITGMLQKAAIQLKCFEKNMSEKRSQEYEEGVRLLITILNVLGSKADAERYNKLLEGI